MLYLATLGLSVPLIVRGSLDLVREFDDKSYNLFEIEYPGTFNILFYVICDLIPLFF